MSMAHVVRGVVRAWSVTFLPRGTDSGALTNVMGPVDGVGDGVGVGCGVADDVGVGVGVGDGESVGSAASGVSAGAGVWVAAGAGGRLEATGSGVAARILGTRTTRAAQASTPPITAEAASEGTGSVSRRARGAGACA
jgi:hypothetical protein